MEIDILIEEPAWNRAELGDGLEELVDRVCPAVLTELDLAPDSFSVSVLACNDARIAALNGEFRGKPTPTNVLSWPAEDRAAQSPGTMPRLPQHPLAGPPEELGDIAISFETCQAEAAAAAKPLADHVAHLMAHGTLHLLGFDHETDADAELMESLETRILARLGIPDPY